MAFKLRSGNTAPFKAMGEEKETNRQYNARIKSEYEKVRKEHADTNTDRRPRWEHTDGTLVDYSVGRHKYGYSEENGNKLVAVDQFGYDRNAMGPFKPPTYKEELPPLPPPEKGDLRKPVELQKAPSLGMKNIDMGQVDEPQPTKALPYELVKNNSKHFTTERVGQATHTYPKGDDGLALVRLKDQAGRVVFSGSQTEFTQKYGDVLKRGSKKYGQEDREDRFYINR